MTVEKGRSPGTGRALAAAYVAAVLVVTAGCGGPSEEDPAGPSAERSPSSRTGPDLSGADLWLSFDNDEVGYSGTPEYPDVLGRPLVGRVVTANGGRVESVPGAPGQGRSVAFPARCAAPEGCPRAMIEVSAGPALDPADEPFAYGASVWLDADQTSAGSNIVQKGRYGTTGGQWKLQVDGEAGHPSCVIRSGTTVVTVRSSRSVADSAWHRVVCRRDARGVEIEVDGLVDRRDARIGSVTNEWPVRIGSPGVGDDDDQFHGRIDDVFLDIGLALRDVSDVSRAGPPTRTRAAPRRRAPSRR